MATFTATERRAHLLAATSHGGAYNVINLCSTVEVVATTTTIGQTISFGRIPSNARILGSSKLYWDALATTGSPALDIGLAAVNGNLAQADDPNALSDGNLVTSAGTGKTMPADIANIGLPAWDLVASETSDPGGELEVTGIFTDAVFESDGTVTADLYYVVD